MRNKLQAFIDTWQNGTIICTTNYLQELSTPFRDRFKKLMFKRPPLENWLPRIVEIFRMEGFTLNEEQVRTLFNNLDGSARDIVGEIESFVCDFRMEPDKYADLFTSNANPDTKQRAKRTLALLKSRLA